MKNVRRSGLILLVVLGMLSLFSLLAVTYVVFAGQSRAASLAMARRDYRGTPPERLLDQALKQVLRGTDDAASALYTHGLLDDLYGAYESPITVQARTSTNDRSDRPKPGYTSPLPRPIPAGTDEAPKLYGGHLLKIPLEYNTSLPEQHDAWAGRVLTFLEGPLANQSVRIIRYVGEIDFSNVITFKTFEPIQYSLIVDLSDIEEKYVTLGQTTQTITKWASQEANGAALLYANYSGNLSSPYSLMINAGELNSHGLGIDMGMGGVPEGTAPATAAKVPALASQPSPNDQLQAPYNAFSEAFLPNVSYLKRSQEKLGGTYTPTGDTDENYDAADYQNFFLTLLSPDASGALTTDRINPAFHRQAIVNSIFADPTYLNLASMTPLQMAAVLEMVQRAVARPLSYRIKNISGLNIPNNTLSSNIYFTGSTKMENSAALGARSPQLELDWSNRNNATEQEKYYAWIRWLTRGPWDVDNDGDGVQDSVWVDINMPLMTSSEGKLLKVLAAFYINDMDSKLDINAAGSQAMADKSTNFQYLPANDPRYAYNMNYPGQSFWPQGLGEGTADISLQPLFDSADNYLEFMKRRYDDGTKSFVPGVTGDDGFSNLLARNRPATHANNSLPGLPKAMHGRMGVALDLLGNPILVDSSLLNQTTEDPYEFRALGSAHSDTPFTFAEWERIVRYNEWDRSMLPRGIETTTGNSLKIMPSNTNFFSRARSMSPRNVALTVPGFAGTYKQTRLRTGNSPSVVPRRVTSFMEFIEAYAQKRFSPGVYPYFSSTALEQLFPIEFHQNRPLNLNRPTGDGVDNDSDGLVDERDELAGHGIDNNPSGMPSSPIDEPAEVASFPAIHQRIRYGNTFDNYLEDYTVGAARFDNAHDPSKLSADQYYFYNGNQPKQLLARHLYCLAQLILPDDYEFPGQPTPTDPTERMKMRARMLAQWAVNVVDFRDADATMTRFAYDSTPFTAQTVGGQTVFWNPTYWDPNDASPPQPVKPGDGVVFGVEAPELLITESLATHDLRIRQHPSPPPMTNRYQQLRIPEGSLFLEFYCPRSTDARSAADNNLAGVPRPLYNVAGTRISLDLGLKTPKQMLNAAGSTVNVTQYPVWRVLLTEPDFTRTDTPYEEYRQKAQRYSYSYQVGAQAAGMPWKINTPNSDPKINRILWFTGDELIPDTNNTAFPDLTNAEKKVYFRRSPDNVYLQGGQYLVVGPRQTTYFGSKIQSSPPVNKPNNHRIQLAHNSGNRPNWVQLWNQSNDPGLWLQAPMVPPPAPRASGDPDLPQSPYVRQCVTMVAGADAPAGWPIPNPYNNNLNPFVGISVSEPTPDNYYTAPTTVLNTSDNATPSDTDTGANGFNTLPPDAYLDLAGGSNNAPAPFDSDPTNGFLASAKWPTVSQNQDLRPEVASKDDWSTAILQRLADPTVPWHAQLNPYITVDMLTIDLTVFSGEMTIPPDRTPFKFATRQKSGATVRSSQDADQINTGDVGKTFYSYHSEPLADAQANTAVGKNVAYFDYELPLEVTAPTPNSTAPIYPPAKPRNATIFATLGYLNSRYYLRGYSAGATNNYVDTNSNPTLRRFQGAPMNPVGLYHPNRDFVSALELTSVPMSAPGTLMQEFTSDLPTDSKTPTYGHTLDFEENGDASNSAWLNRKKAAGLLLQLLNVESPWGDAWKIENPLTTVVTQSTDVLQNALLAPYRAPYNLIPTFREPGRVNLNTVTEPLVLRGLMYNAITPGGGQTRDNAPVPFASQLELLRQGYASVGSPTLPNANPRLNAAIPTEFLGVFGTGLSIDKIPNAASAPLRTNSTAQGTLLAHDIDLVSQTRGGRLFAAASGTPNNTFMQYYPASRLANLTTTRSNVFSVRVVLGYFEYDSVNGIGVEYGSEQGRARRNRGFYLLDRSIPVGYQVGKDYNSDNCILVRRIIE